MYWPPEVKEKLTALIADTPPQYKRYTADAIAAGEIQSKKSGRTEMDEESMVRGYIVSVPRHLRDGIEEVLSNHNFDLLYYRPTMDEPNFPNHLRKNPAPTAATPVPNDHPAA